MKKIANGLIGVLALMLVAGGTAEATRGPQGITKTIHNLSTSQVLAQWRSDEEQVCIFCHTPHGGSLDGPLWNRPSPDSVSYTHYNSASLSSYLQTLGVNRAVEKESLLCLSCHDGSIGVNSLVNYSYGYSDTEMPIINGVPGERTLVYMFGPGPVLGTDLSDDHPVSFVYLSAAGSRVGTMYHSIGDAEISGARFFPPNAADSQKRVECSSCHDPHVMYDSGYGGGNPQANEDYRPFLITSNVGSGLCLACHVK